tara:strand:+ start:1357 stop:1986 length:630 start_codon:yes stop_codon:yes gene_type:complete
MKLRSAVLPLIIANIGFFILQLAFDNFNITESLMLISKDIPFRPWILVTSMFVHGSPNHILFNMYALFLFGPFLERRIGPSRFLILYFGSGILASLLSSYFYPRALGASGAIMGILGALIILLPHLRLLFFFVIPMPLWVAGIVWALIDAFGIFVPSGVGNIAHLVGLGSGLLFGLYFKRIKREFTAKFSSKAHLDESDANEYLKSGRI